MSAGVSYELAEGTHVEFLNTTSRYATYAIDLTGNNFEQRIRGNDGANILDDGGPGAADTMIGHLGDDTYAVHNAGATIVEALGEGQDTLATSVSFTLAAGVSVEAMRTTASSGTATIGLTGNEFGQEIVGNAGANRLDGKDGADTLFGSGGGDTFVFSTTLGIGNVDTISDLKTGVDKIELASVVFTTLAAGALAAAAFVATATGVALDASDRIIYDTDSGALLYDADGDGVGSAAIQFATLDPGLGLSASDFVVV